MIQIKETIKCPHYQKMVTVLKMKPNNPNIDRWIITCDECASCYIDKCKYNPSSF